MKLCSEPSIGLVLSKGYLDVYLDKLKFNSEEFYDICTISRGLGPPHLDDPGR